MKMITQEKVWSAIDKIVKDRDMSFMAFSQMCGLDKSTLFPTKRTLPYGIIRYPGFTTIEKILRTTGISFVEFAKMVEENAES